MKKVIAMSLAAILIITAIVIFNPIKPVNIVQAEEFRKGFSLVPEEYDSSGIKTSSSFTLKSEKEVSLDYLIENLTLDGADKPEVKQVDAQTFIVKPLLLKENKLYTFRLVTEDGQEVTWAFQTSVQFSVLGSLPENTGTNVPIDTGIEIYFSHKEFEDISSYFEISPTVEGSFEIHGHAAVFVPKKELAYGTLYTVTIKKGLPLKGSDQKLQEDYVFSFETTPDQQKEDTFKGHFYYRNMLNEFAPSESPKLSFGYYLRDYNTKTISIATKVYAFPNVDEFINAITDKESVPYWAYYSWQNNSFESKKLRKVTEVTQDFASGYSSELFIDLPELEEGYYLVESSWEDISFQTLLQVTDLGVFISDSSTKTLVWVNSIEKDAPVENAVIQDINNGKSFRTGPDGVALFDSPQSNDDEEFEPKRYYKITSPDGKSAVLPCYSYGSGYRYNRYGDYSYYYHGYGENLFWRYFQTDRSLYKPDDEVEFWGFLKGRYTDEDINELTVEIGQGYWFWAQKSIMSFFRPFIGKPLISETIAADNGFYEGSFKLPNLEPGGYQVTVKHKGEVVSSYYITVENYVKPAYTLAVTKDKEAIFAGETVNFTILTSFFEGTPVANLDVRYALSSLSTYKDGNAKTDLKGQVNIPFTPLYGGSGQGETGAYINSSATLPESGEINGSAFVRVFINDINVQLKSEFKDGKSIITADVNKIDLSRLNNGTAKDYGDFLSDAVSGKTLTGSITRHTYVKIESGQYYDFINKKVQKTYRYEERTSNVGSFSMTTDAEGKAVFETTLLEEDNAWYTAEINCTDNSGKQMQFQQYLNNRYWNYRYYPNESYNLESMKDKYRLGEEVRLTYKYGQEALPEGSYLYIESQNGIRDYVTEDNSTYSGVFESWQSPNYYVHAVYFNGSTYVTQSTNVAYDYEEKKIDITAEADKESYKPGDKCTITIKAKNPAGAPIPARINLAIVDEALLKLSGQYVDVLQSLYSWVGSGISFTYGSHYNRNDTGIYYGARDEMAKAEMSDGASPTIAASATVTGGAGNAGAPSEQEKFDSTYVRKEFKDTAYFKTITLDENGEGEVSFILPDNVTSWSVTLAGLSTALDGGTGEADLKVTLPFFISQSMNSTYLVGDMPYIGVTAYGNSLEEGDIIKYQLTSPQKPDYVQVMEGKAFERINLPLWQLEEGSWDIVIKALGPDDSSDGFQQTIKVVATFHEIEAAEYTSLKPGTAIPSGTGGITTLLFSDEGRGKFLPGLYNLVYSGGNRIDQKYLSKLARDLMVKYFPDITFWSDAPDVALSDYLNQDGGCGILPYAGSDLRTTALLTSLIKEEAGFESLKQYFYSFVLSDDGSVSPMALYGLAVLGEPVLLELDRAAAAENLKTEDYIFLALAYAELGEIPKADSIFVSRLVPEMEDITPYVRILKKGDSDLTLQNTALASVLMSKLGREQKDGMYKYVNDNWSKEVLISLEKLLYIKSEIDKAPQTSAEFSYTYDGNSYTEKLENGGAVMVKIPSQKISDLKITKVTGSVGVISIFRKMLTENIIPDKNLSVSREFYNHSTGEKTESFSENDIVKVVINWNIFRDAIDSCYEITDFAPAGLKPIESPWQMGIKPESSGEYWYYRDIEGQKVTFYVSRYYDERKPFVYYARVINPGTFMAEAPIIQGTTSRDSLMLGNTSSIVISEQ